MVAAPRAHIVGILVRVCVVMCLFLDACWRLSVCEFLGVHSLVYVLVSKCVCVMCVVLDVFWCVLLCVNCLMLVGVYPCVSS